MDETPTVTSNHLPVKMHNAYLYHSVIKFLCMWMHICTMYGAKYEKQFFFIAKKPINFTITLSMKPLFIQK